MAGPVNGELSRKYRELHALRQLSKITGWTWRDELRTWWWRRELRRCDDERRSLHRQV